MRHRVDRDKHVAGLRMLESRIKRRSRECRKNPRPGTHGVVRDVEPQHGEQSVPLIFSAENSLRDVTASAGLRSGIPECPPLHAQMHHKCQHRQSPKRFGRQSARKIGQHCRDIRRSRSRDRPQGRKFCEHRGHSSGGLHTVICNRNDDGHLQHKLKQVGPQYSPEPAQRNIKSRERNQEENADGQTRVFALAEHRSYDAGHRLGHPTEDQAIHQHAKVNRAKSSQKCCRFSRITHFSELHISEQPRALPNPREKKYRHHSRRQKAPPQPVPCNSLRVNQAGDDERSIRGKRRRHHGRSRQPPRHLTPRDEIFFGVATRPAPKKKSEQERQQQISEDYGPIEQRQRHEAVFPYFCRTGTRLSRVCCSATSSRTDKSVCPAKGCLVSSQLASVSNKNPSCGSACATCWSTMRAAIPN